MSCPCAHVSINLAEAIDDIDVGFGGSAGLDLKIDVIGGEWLTEINVTSPTGIVAIDKFNGTDTAGAIWDAIDARLAARG